MSSLKTHQEVVLDPFGFPAHIQWNNYVDILSTGKINVNDTSFFGMVFNSVYFSVAGAFLSAMFTSMLAYVTTKYKFPGSKIYPVAVFVAMFLPIYGTGGATYKLWFNLGLIDSYLFVLTACGGMTVYYLYFSAFYRNLSWGYAEAAEMDGANEFQIYFKTMLPQSMTLFWSLFILIWLGQWNDVSTGLLYLKGKPTLSMGLYFFQINMIHDVSKQLLFAGCFLACIPPLLIFIFCNKILTTNVSLGGFKE
jgi:multiple sugar transport system permease protein